MISPSQNAAVVNYLLDHSQRPMQAVRLWALCFVHLNNDTGEIMLRHGPKIRSTSGMCSATC
jgi:hypothetical protein